MAAASQPMFQSLQLLQDPRTVGKVHLAIRGQAQPPGGPVQQPHAQAFLKSRKPSADHRRSHAELLRRCSHGAKLGNQPKEMKI